MQISAAMPSERSTMVRASSSVFSVSARAAACAYGPPEPMAVGAPVLGQFDGRAGQIAVFLDLALEALEQREGIGGTAGEAGQYLAVGQPPHLARVALHHGVAERYLPVAAEHDRAIAAHRQNRR